MGARGAMPGSVVGGAMLLAVAAALLAGPAGSAGAATQDELTRYSIVHGCFALRPADGGRFLAQTGDGYTASARGKGKAEPFRMQATDLGRYLFYGPARDFLALGGDGAAIAATRPSDDADWTVRGAGGRFRVVNEAAGLALAVADSGDLVPVPAGEAETFEFKRAAGCAKYPEVSLNVKGKPSTGSPRYGEVKGLVEGHMHGMAFEFLGGKAHCGRPWHRFGAPYALRDCPDHELAGGCAAVLENVLFGNPARCHDPVGWPTFAEWPHPQSLTHESLYYRWLERAWRGGLRVFVNLFVENRVLCEVYPFKRNNCNEMQSVLLQAKRIRQLEDYVDARSGGPGKGWFRIVRSPFQARRVINRGKLAVVQGMEVSEPFGCRLNPVPPESPNCDAEDVDSWIDRLDDLGLRQVEIINKFDNALSGVAGDSGALGVAIDGGQFLTSGSFWDLGPCEDPHNHDRSPATAVVPHNDDMILGNGLRELLGTLPPLPVHPAPPACNQRGLSDLGRHAIRELIDHEIIFDPDHMSVLGRNQALDLVERIGYPGLISSHSWSTPNALPRIYKMGGMVTPYAGDSVGFVHKWRELRQARKGRQYFGVGYGADANGFGAQGSPRPDAAENPVEYPFKSFDGEVTLDRGVSGERVWDINVDGVAHYGLYPDWIEDLRVLAGNRIVRDMGRGAEAYLQVWERAYGVPERGCRGWQKRRLSARGIGKALRLGAKQRRVLEHAGQPQRRTRIWRWCAGGEGEKRREVAASFGRGARAELVLSNLRRHRAAGIAPGAKAGRIAGAERVTGGVRVERAGGDRAFVYRVRDGRVTHVGVATGALLRQPGKLQRKLRRAAR